MGSQTGVPVWTQQNWSSETILFWGVRHSQLSGDVRPFFGSFRGVEWYNLLKARFAALCRMICWMLTVCHHSIPAVLLKKGWDMLHNNVPLSKSLFSNFKDVLYSVFSPWIDWWKHHEQNITTWTSILGHGLKPPRVKVAIFPWRNQQQYGLCQASSMLLLATSKKSWQATSKVPNALCTCTLWLWLT